MIWHGTKGKFYQFIKNAPMPIVITILHFLKIKRELIFRNTMELNQFFFSIVPEPFHPINIDLPRGESFRMIDIQMPTNTEH